ncbi:MAG TPA: transposase [Nakamurella sp.]
MLSVQASSRGAARRRGFGRRVLIGTVDERLTAHAGLAAVTEVNRVLGVGQVLDAAIGRFKRRRRGVSAGGLLVSMGVRAVGRAGLPGRDGPAPRRCGRAGVGTGPDAGVDDDRATGEAVHRNASGRDRGRGSGRSTRGWSPYCPSTAACGCSGWPRSTPDTTDVEVYGRKKQDAVYNYQGQRAYRPHITFWAEGGTPLAADLMRADEDPRPVAADLLDRADKALPPGVEKVQCRWDAGYFAADLAIHCVQRGNDFAIGVKRNTAVVRACRSAPADGWHPPGSRNSPVWTTAAAVSGAP